MKLEFPLLSEDDIEVRVQAVSPGKGCSLLLYKTARVDANILDNHKDIGCFNWKKSFYELKGNIYCSLSIYDNDKHEWVSKDDCGKESQTESEKGEASDAFKRSGFAWGIGRELYTAPFIWYSDSTITKESAKTLKFSVKSITYTDTKPCSIKTLEIVNNKGEVVYTYGLGKKLAQQTQFATINTPPFCDGENVNLPSDNRDKLLALLDKFGDKKERWEHWLLTHYNVESIGAIPEDKLEQAIAVLSKYVDRQ